MPGSLTIPNVLAGIAGPANANLSLLDGNWNQIRDYVNNREIVQDTFANRPAASIAGRWFFATDTAVLYADTGAAWTQVALGTLSATFAETLTGLGLTNSAGDLTNDIDCAVGAASSEDAVIANRVLMSLTSALTKQLDVAWAVGTNQGGRMSAAGIANTTYHIHLIRRTDTGVVDVGFDTSATAPTLPANYTRSRRIGAIIRSAGAILGFVQDADLFQLNTPVLDVDANNPGTGAVTRTLTVPIGIQVIARLNGYATSTIATTTVILLSDLAIPDVAASSTVAPLGQLAIYAGANVDAVQVDIRTNTSGQIRSRFEQSDASTSLRLATTGWFDRRGRG